MKNNFYMILMMLAVFSIVSACGRGPDEGGQAVTSSTSVLTVIGVSPTNGAADIPINSKIIITFSTGISSDSGSYLLKDANSTVVATAVSVSGTVATLTPSANLAGNTSFRLSVSGVKDSAGNAMVGEFSSEFTTGSSLCSGTSPSVIAVSPTDGAVNVPVDTKIMVTFSDVISSDAGSYLLKDANGTTVAITVSVSGAVATLTPNANLAGNTSFRLSVSGVKNSAGDAMTGEFSSDFTTANIVSSDVTPPSISAISPSSGSDNVALSAPIIITFSEAISSGTGSYSLKDANGTAVATTVSVSGTVATLTPNASLAEGTFYTLTVSEVKDLAGNVMVGNISSYFVTVAGSNTAVFKTATLPFYAEGDGSRAINSPAGQVSVFLSGGYPYQVNLTLYPVNVTADPNVKYILSFICSSSSPQLFDVEMKKYATPFTLYASKSGVLCDGTIQQINLYPTQSDTIAQIAINLGAHAGTYNFSPVMTVTQVGP